MNLKDPYYKKLSKSQKNTLKFSIFSFIIIAIAGYCFKIFTITESVLILIIGLTLMALMRLQYHVEDLDKKLKKK